MILPCKCNHPAQDTLHGKGNRVFNPKAKKSGDQQTLRCTVCRAETKK